MNPKNKQFGIAVFVFLLGGFWFVFISCSKLDIIDPVFPEQISDSLLVIENIDHVNINEVDIKYYINPPKNESFSKVYIVYSTSENFSEGNDSVLLSQSVSETVNAVYSLKGLKQTTKYFAKIALTYNNELYYSGVKEWSTGFFRITDSYWNDTMYVNRKAIYSISTNFTPGPSTGNEVAKVFIGDIECTVTSDAGSVVFFETPENIEPGTYSLRIEKKKLTAQTKETVVVMRGRWSAITPAILPLGYPDRPTGLGYYGSCFSSTKGWIFGGHYIYEVDYTSQDAGRPGYVMEFDGTSLSWTRKDPVNPRYFEDQIAYYYNNAIYVISGIKTDKYSLNVSQLQRMQKLNLSDWTWQDLDSFPFRAGYSPFSFELNGEWYVGCGMYPDPERPSTQVHKYNPATNMWTKLADFPGKYHMRSTGFSLNGKGYVYLGNIAFGMPEPEYEQEMWEYDPVFNKWNEIKFAPGTLPRGEKYQIISYNNKVYILTGQSKDFGAMGAYFSLEAPCLEFDPVNKTLTRVANNQTAGVMQLIFKKDNVFYFQSDALGYITAIPNVTNKFVVE